jgi:holo-[acyl-carrier protein] synthase
MISLPPGGILIGLGCDLIETERIHSVLKRHGDRFLKRVFTEEEQAYCNSLKFPHKHYAARWAAKEAVSKALGCGFGAELGLASVEVVTDPSSGAPSIRLDALGERTLRKRGGSRVLISLSHDGGMATAYAVIVT